MWLTPWVLQQTTLRVSIIAALVKESSDRAETTTIMKRIMSRDAGRGCSRGEELPSFTAGEVVGGIELQLPFYRVSCTSIQLRYSSDGLLMIIHAKYIPTI